MHASSYDIVRKFASDYVKDDDVVLEVGSCNVNGSHREIFKNCQYIGLDIEPGSNVDIVVADPYHWEEIETSSIDVVICASVIEHVKYPWKTFQEIQRVLKPNGRFCIVAPAVWEEHKYPVDCYRFYPDGMIALCEQAHLQCNITGLSKAYNLQIILPDEWMDCYCIGVNLYNS